MVISIGVPDDDVCPGLVPQELHLDVLEVTAIVGHGPAGARADQVALHLVALAVQGTPPPDHLDACFGSCLTSVSSPAPGSI